MDRPVTLLMAVHCHQPVGNFGFVFDEAYAKAYEPFLRVLERHPGVRLALHYSGPLLDWLTDRHPEFVERVRRLVKRGQVELLASGYYEPILPLIPEPDRQGQIAQMRSSLRKLFHVETKGLWLTERVWEPQLPQTLASAGIRYTMIDTNQFASAKAWLPRTLQVQDEAFWDLLGCYATDYVGSSVVLFPASKRLRYWLPFQPVDRTIEFLRQLPREEASAITFADDGEKFGFWPKTFQWVYEEGWLEQFFSAIEREHDWLTTTTFHDYLEAATPNGTVYPPSGSYEEMLEWSGGHFRNFFTKYPEANMMYQYMLRVSQQLREVSSVECRVSNRSLSRSRRSGHSSLVTRHSKLIARARRELYAGQCNCAYWHGIFGGLYLSHLRRAVYDHLIRAEKLLARAPSSSTGITIADADGDGQEEVRLTTATMGVLVDPSEGGAVTEWHCYQAGVNLLDTLSRRQEPYHEKLKTNRQPVKISAGGTPASIHDLLDVKEENLAAHLIYDDHRRGTFLDYGFESLPSLQEAVRSTWGERRIWSTGSFRMEPVRQPARRTSSLSLRMIRDVSGGSVRKTVRVITDRPSVECAYELERVGAPIVGLECNFSLRDERYLTTPGQQAQASAFTIEEAALGLRLNLSIDPPGLLFHFPVETISESEEGLERTYQGLCVVCLWTVPSASRWRSLLRCTLEAC